MQDIEPHYNWRHLYISENDSNSPFFEREYSEFEYSDVIYNFYIHPQWDNIGSPTLFIKIIFADYNTGHAIIELIGEWNDCIHNDIMFLKRDIIDQLSLNGIDKFVLIGENVLNFHYSDDCYYEEWFDDIPDGWIIFLNFQHHVLQEFSTIGIDQYINWGGELDNESWRTFTPQNLLSKLEKVMNKRLGY
jgi:hypothetical protein